MSEVLTKSMARNIFYGGSLFFIVIFLGLSFHSHRYIVNVSTADAELTEAVAEGKHVWERHACINCHTLLGEGAYFAPEVANVMERWGVLDDHEAAFETLKGWMGKDVGDYDPIPPKATQIVDDGAVLTLAGIKLVIDDIGPGEGEANLLVHVPEANILFSGDATNPGVLDVGEIWTYQASYTILQANIDDGNDLDNTAAFTGNSPTGPVSGQDDVAVSLAGFSDISLDKTPVSASFARPGDVVTWQLTVTNTGDTTLSAMTITDDYADTAKYMGLNNMYF